MKTESDPDPLVSKIKKIHSNSSILMDISKPQNVNSESSYLKKNINHSKTSTDSNHKPLHILIFEFLLFFILNFKLLNEKSSKLVEYLMKRKSILVKKFPIKNTFYHFCGGESKTECLKVINELNVKGIGTILDYSKESASEIEYEKNKNEFKEVIELSVSNKSISHAVIKSTSLIDADVLHNISIKKFSNEDMVKYKKFEDRVYEISRHAYKNNTKLLIDAEHSWLQPAIDETAKKMMLKFNQDDFVIFNTIQLYKRGSYEHLINFHSDLNSLGIKTGLKIVRGAYLEIENERALKMNYKSPIERDFDSSTNNFNNAVLYCIENLDTISFVAGTHNQDSIDLIKHQMLLKGIQNSNKNIYFAQLYGMANHSSDSLAKEGYNVTKYVPYGKLEEVLPYLIRRFNENKSINGQISRELKIRKTELINIFKK